jgi:N-carbamoyl-L-amino-acid hydrolase
VRRAADRHGAVATIGRLRIEPNGTNAIASAAHAWLDARAADDEMVDRLVAEIRGEVAAAATRHRVQMNLTRESWSPLTTFDVALRDRLADVVAAVGASDDGERPATPILPTGAGHDAAILAAEVPTAMLFVRNPTGVSHSPAEHADRSDCLAGVAALAGVLRELTCR